MRIDEQRFYDTLSKEFANFAPVNRLSKLGEDLGLDSLALLELREALEEIAGRPVPDELWREIGTAGELYDWFETVNDQRTAQTGMS